MLHCRWWMCVRKCLSVVWYKRNSVANNKWCLISRSRRRIVVKLLGQIPCVGVKKHNLRRCSWHRFLTRLMAFFVAARKNFMSRRIDMWTQSLKSQQKHLSIKINWRVESLVVCFAVLADIILSDDFTDVYTFGVWESISKSGATTNRLDLISVIGGVSKVCDKSANT